MSNPSAGPDGGYASTVRDYLPQLIPLPDQSITASYKVSPSTSSAIKSSLFGSLLTSLPTTSHLLPRAVAPSTRHALKLLEESDWSLSAAQKEATRQLAKAKEKGKGKQPQRFPGNGFSFGHQPNGDETESEMEALGPEYSEERRGMPCGHLFKKGEAIYRCRDCGLDDTCVQCAPCFQNSIHVREGHDIVFSVSSASGGCCDCGDDEAWKRDVGCKFHCARREEAESMEDDTDQASTSASGMEVEPEGSGRSEGSTTKGKAPERFGAGSELSGLAELDRILADLVPRDLQDPLHGTIEVLLNFILEVLEHAPEDMTVPSGPDAIDIISRLPSLENATSQNKRSESHGVSAPANRTDDEDSEMSEGLSGGEDDEDPTLEAPGAFHEQADFKGKKRAFMYSSSDAEPATRPRASAYDSSAMPRKRQYSVLLWNDEKHSFRQVIDTVTDATGITELAAKNVAERVDQHGRAIIQIDSELRYLLNIARVLSQIDLTVTIRPAFDVFAEEVAHVLVEFLIDLANSSLYLPQSNPANGSLYAHPHDAFKPNAAVIKMLIAREMLAKWNSATTWSAGSMSTDFFDPGSLTKLEGLLLMDAKMWKSLRAEMKGLYISLIGPKEVKKEIASCFASVYAKLIETFILRDREPESSISLMTVQLFSVPSIASQLVESESFLYKLFLILQAIFTGQMASSTNSLILPPMPPPRGQASPQLMLLRQQRCYHIFYDVRYLLASEGVQKQIAASPKRHLKYFLGFLSLFHSINPDKRAVSTHVEFESEVWIPVFHVSSHLGKAAKLFGEAFSRATPAQIRAALAFTARNILMSCYTLHQNDPDNHAPITCHWVQYGSEASDHYHVVEFAVDRQPVSFHHPMHWLLAEILKQVSASRSGSNAASSAWEEEAQSMIDLFLPEVDENGMLVVLDFPLRVCVKLAQIRCNMWVRNGFVIRSQAHHYRDNSMRDIMHDQDVFLLQVGLLLIQPDRFLVSILDRFGLLKWFEGADVERHPIYDQDQAVFLAEELLFLLITCFSEISAAAAWSMEQQVRRELVHYLALNQGTYSEVTKHISERLTDHQSFERVLAAVSNFRAPDGTNDFGIFELKDECYDEVQPFFFHYTRNQRERAEEVLRLRKKKKLGPSVKDEDVPPVTPPRQLDSLDGSLFAGLSKALNTRTLMNMLFYAIRNVRVEFKDAPDMLVDAALQIIMIGLVEIGQDFACNLVRLKIAATEKELGSETSTFSSTSSHGSTLQLLCAIETEEKFKAFRPKISWCLEKASSLSEEARAAYDAHKDATGRSKGSGAKSGAASAEDAKRAAARARQAAIMKQFSAQQKSLLDSLEAEDDDEGDEDLMGDEKTNGSKVEGKEPKKTWGSCILCQESLCSEDAFGTLAHIQPSRVMRTTPKQDAASLQHVFETPLTLDRSGSDGKRVTGPGRRSGGQAKSPRSQPYECFPQEDHRFGFHASTCGHLMHLHCFETYCRSVEQRHAQQIARNHPEDLSRSEFVCPLCKSLGNVILPVPDARPLSPTQFSATPLDETPLSDWIRKINIDILKHSSRNQSGECQEMEHGTGSFLPFFAELSPTLLVRPEWAKHIDYPTLHMLDRLISVLKPLSSQAKGLRERYQQRTILAPQTRKMYMPEELLSYTLAILEIAQRGMTPALASGNANSLSRTVADGIPDTSIDLLRSLIHCLRSLTLVHIESTDCPGIARQGLLKRLLPHWGGDDAVRSPLLLRETLTIVVEAAIISPQSLQQITALMFYATLVQVVFGLAQPSIWPQANGPGSAGGPSPNRIFAGFKSTDISKADIEASRRIFPDVRWTVANIIGFVGYARGNITLGFDNLDDDTLAKTICSYTLPFLRRAAILHRAVTGQSPTSSVEGDANESEYERLLRLLKIPAPSVALPIRAEKQTPIAGLVEGWIKHAYAPLASLFRPLPIQPSPLSSSSNHFGSGPGSSQPSHLHTADSHPTLLLEHPHIYELANLPSDLAMLLQETQRRKCRRCMNVPPEPALCLHCGDILCYQNFCCQDEEEERGECNRHTDECGGASGMFFKVKTNIVMLLYQGNGTFNFSPYLDSHGEIDIGLRKGRPQRLHPQRYDELRKQWLAHGIANMVARKIEAAMDQGGWQTF
ncbi:hypothetical protein IE53DRAFT_202971 [Violaceomyces palustris]|uniref:Uncharacterized protein n=1 Tax=Violaceomyces palustris TaxID=1673888 RepID=A0ACD0NR41_9BASI|nr:hypothetical protein IE53DRAFT_202971 [Violaceomyces palustris]